MFLESFGRRFFPSFLSKFYFSLCKFDPNMTLTINRVRSRGEVGWGWWEVERRGRGFTVQPEN